MSADVLQFPDRRIGDPRETERRLAALEMHLGIAALMLKPVWPLIANPAPGTAMAELAGTVDRIEKLLGYAANAAAILRGARPSGA